MDTETDYKKRYEDMVRRCKELHKDGNALTKKQMEIVCPELAKSEDERIRKWILEYLYDGLRKADEQFKDHFKSAIDWLERQKEQKPTNDSVLETAIRSIKAMCDSYEKNGVFKDEIERLKKSNLLYPAEQWDAGFGFACEQILSFLDTIKEQPVEIQKYRAYLIDEVEKQYKQAEQNYQEAYEQKNETRMFDEAERDAWERVLNWLKEEHGYDSSNENLVPEKEQPVCEGLEEEIKRCVYEPFFDLNGVAIKGSSSYISVEDVAEIARHFAQWGAKHRGSSETPKELEEAAKKYAEDNTWVNEFTNDGEIPEWYKHTAEVFKAGASWQKEQFVCIGKHAVNDLTEPSEIYIRKD